MIHDENRSTAITSGILLQHIHATKTLHSDCVAVIDREEIKNFLVKSIFGGCLRKK